MATPKRQAILALRIKAEVKRPAFAERAGISYNHLYGIECGEHVASLEVLSAIARCLSEALGEPVELGDICEDAPEPLRAPSRQPNPTTHPEPNRPAAPPRETKSPKKVAGAA